MMLTCRDGLWYINYNFANDLALGRGQGVQEFLEARRETMFHWDDHYARLISSCSARISIVLKRLPSKEQIEKMAGRLLKKGGLDESLVRILVTSGDSHDTKTALGYPTLSLDIRPLPVAPKKPFKLKTMQTMREFPQCKFTAGYGYADIYEAEARDQGFDKFLYWSPRNGITEGAYENVFFVTKSGGLITQGSGVLEGITRKIVLERAGESGIFSFVDKYSPLHFAVLDGCDEAFLTSTTLHVHPVLRIDDYSFKVGKGTYTEKTLKMFLDCRENYYKERGA